MYFFDPISLVISGRALEGYLKLQKVHPSYRYPFRPTQMDPETLHLGLALSPWRSLAIPQLHSSLEVVILSSKKLWNHHQMQKNHYRDLFVAVSLLIRPDAKAKQSHQLRKYLGLPFRVELQVQHACINGDSLRNIITISISE